MTRRFPLLARGLVLIIALALAATGLGHRMASASDLERAQFAQLFGAEFCVTDEDGAPVASASCPVCHLVASVYMPEAVLGADTPVFTRVSTLDLPRDAAAPCPAPRASPPSRGPPTV